MLALHRGYFVYIYQANLIDKTYQFKRKQEPSYPTDITNRHNVRHTFISFYTIIFQYRYNILKYILNYLKSYVCKVFSYLIDFNQYIRTKKFFSLSNIHNKRNWSLEYVLCVFGCHQDQTVCHKHTCLLQETLQESARLNSED